ncbi:MAG: hypothetical protein HDS69_07330 [Bacteroidales bacterium]|nr:hypothetical protein [Bacteroidales bacterium]
MTLLNRTILLTALAMPASGYALEADTATATVPAIQRVAMHGDMMRSMPALSFDNPALKQWEQSYSYTSLTVDAVSDRANRAVDTQRGKGETAWSVGAESQMKYKSSTLWGSAAYRNGRKLGINWNESSDADIIYPYFTADSIGGDMRMETYSFAGGYADHTDRWGWGVTAAYTAGLYYRNIDPRPRNTTSRLDIAAGGSMRIGASAYLTGVTVNYRKYKQSCDIEFVNELSDNRIWHLTGLGTHYERFAGNGYNHYYNGQRFGAGINLFPESRRGAVASVGFSSFSFDHILTALNKLPLQSATDNQLTAQAGWLAPGRVHDIAAVLTVTCGKRKGTENLFGDPSGNVYPQIGALDLYAHSYLSATVNALWQWRPAASALLSVNPRIAFDRSDESYLDPRRKLLLTSLTPALTVMGGMLLGRDWHASASLDFACALPVDNVCDLPYQSGIPAGMQAADRDRYDILSKSHTLAGVSAELTRAISDNYALSISLSYARHSYTAGIHSDCARAAVSLIF